MNYSVTEHNSHGWTVELASRDSVARLADGEPRQVVDQVVSDSAVCSIRRDSQVDTKTACRSYVGVTDDCIT